MKQQLALKQGLKHQQTVALTPQLQQGVRMLQMSSLELDQEIGLALQKNPFLEKLEMETELVFSGSSLKGRMPIKSDAFKKRGTNAPFRALPQHMSAERQTNVSGKTSDAFADFDEYDKHAVSQPSLHDFLHQQAAVSNLDKKQSHIMMLLVDSVNDRGYLRAKVSEIIELAAPNYVVTVSEVEAVIEKLHEFEPVGVGARSSRECLLIQLSELPQKTTGLDLARLIIKLYLHQLARGALTEIAERSAHTLAEVQTSIELIKTLDPFPGDRFNNAPVQSVTPDLLARKMGPEWVVFLNPNIVPAVCLHHEALDLLSMAKGHSGYESLKKAYTDAQVLLGNIEKRFHTLLRLAQLVVDRQTAFLEQGQQELKPLIQKGIAKRLGVHASTVSRAIKDKYIATPTGTLPLSAFFSAPLNEGEGGGVCSKAVEAKIQTLIAAEMPLHPMSDAKLTALLNKRGIQIARRTVTKYRQRLGILSSDKRRVKYSGEY